MILGFLIALSGLALADAKDSPWQQIKKPSKGKPSAIGQYSAGCLQGGKAIPLDGPGYQIMHPSRNRYYGHPNLVDFIQKLGRAVHERKLGTVLVGDLSLPRGGRATGGHASHQNGLDVDLWYWYPKKATKRKLTEKEREQIKARYIINGKTQSIQAKWVDTVAQVLKLIAQDDRVERVFVHPIIKRDLCTWEQNDKSWLSKIRPWYGHADHSHVRLACPEDSPDCEPQESVSEGDGCDQMDYWFDEKAKAERMKGRKRYQKKVISKPTLPEKCIELLNEEG